jgi:hypothetical protein
MTKDNATVKRILFTGYAPVHFLCFAPLFERLTARANTQVFVSGGLRTKAKGDDEGYLYDGPAMYGPLQVPQEQILSVPEIQEQEFDILFSACTNLIEPKHVPTRIQIFHGISFRNKAVRSANMGCDYYFIIGPYMHRRFQEGGLFHDGDNRGVPVGFMKTDPLLNGRFDRRALQKQFGVEGDRPVLVYAPTGAKDNSLETMGEEVIRRLATTGKYDILIKLHDHPKNKKIDWPARLAPWTNTHCRVVRELDIMPLLYVADLLISDASSVSNEYALLDRPIVFLDTPELLDKERESGNAMMDIETWGQKGGALVKQPQDIEEAVELGLRSPELYRDIRHAMVKDLFYNPGKATDTAMAWLEKNIL